MLATTTLAAEVALLRSNTDVCWTQMSPDYVVRKQEQRSNELQQSQDFVLLVSLSQGSAPYKLYRLASGCCSHERRYQFFLCGYQLAAWDYNSSMGLQQLHSFGSQYNEARLEILFQQLD